MKTITILCSIQFNVPDDVNPEHAKHDLCKLVNIVLSKANLKSKPEIDTTSSVVVTAIEPID